MSLPFPNVPFAPGIPPVPRLPGAATPLVALAASEVISALLWQSSQSTVLWAVLGADGTPAVDPDSTLEFSYRRQYETSDFPVVDGSFASYNKVVMPFEIQLRFSKGGTQSDRENFLNDLDALIPSTDLFTIITPEATYQNCNPDRLEVIRRGAQGAYFFTQVDLYFLQIIEVMAQYTNTTVQLPNAKDASAQPVANVGSLQPQNPSTALQQAGAAAMVSTSPGVYG